MNFMSAPLSCNDRQPAGDVRASHAEHAAHDLSDAALGGSIRIQDGHFTDGYGRTLSLRGLNVSGSSKLPTEPNGLSHLTEGFFEHRTVTFVGRPFPIEEAHLHFRRLQAWGLPLIRLLVTWESIGHAGPNPNTDLDLEYIAYLRQIIELMPKYDIKCFVCAHQDVWSRFSGGSGAPGWTFEAAGLDIEAFTDTGAAYVHGQDDARRAVAPVNEREPSGPFVWPSGYQKLAASTMATLFWAGDSLAPELKCRRSPLHGNGTPEDVSVQSFLQDSLIEAFGRLADEVGPLEACLGFEPMNEPHRGLIHLHDFHSWNYDTELHIGYYPSFAEALALGSGYAQQVPYYVKSWPFPTRISHRTRVDPRGRSAWLPLESHKVAVADRPQGMGRCVWRAHGVWKWDEKKQAPVVLQKDYFEYDHRSGHEGERIEWYRDCYAPFIRRFTERTSRQRSSHLCFVEPIPNEFMPPWQPNESELTTAHRQQTYATRTLITTERPRNFVYTPHFYDLNVLFSKAHNWMSVNVQGLSRGMFILRGLYFGVQGLRKNYRAQLRNILHYGRASLSHVPVIIGEVGIPFDINDKTAFATGDYDIQRQLMNALIAAMEDNLLGFTLWNYNPHNCVEWGDGWNKEDFSVTNGDEIVEHGDVRPDYRNKSHEGDELYRGGRVLDVVIRPYAIKIAGEPLRSDWDPRTLRFEFDWESKSEKVDIGKGDKARLTELFLPKYHYEGHELKVEVSDGEWEVDWERQTLYVRHRVHGTEVARHSLVVEIRDVGKHLRRRVEDRREAFPGGVIPIGVEVWLEGLTLNQVLAGLVAVLAGVVALLAIVVEARR
ncbi:glycoside hydrolase superfamily [Pseudomassariella vexata]|uniref:Glycoside hydrolase superfamily n=1 Tax=Pseudomassariella vexata TaxID=1141098 RepID=A0A1Y2EI43_9PEZI|nr:glycoside hydrolase superfamily [Pseudomassariella vexata]ORY70465.1 glycoside hydrolase superfamily [Pseudomassariella vexata]